MTTTILANHLVVVLSSILDVSRLSFEKGLDETRALKTGQLIGYNRIRNGKLAV